MNGSAFFFLRPEALWLLIVVLPLAWFLSRGSHAGFGGGRGIAVALLRSLLFVCLVVAMARPVFYRDVKEQVVVVIEDVSASTGGVAEEIAGTAIAGLVEYLPASARVEHVRVAARAASVGVAGSGDGGSSGVPGTNLAAALRLAGAFIPDGVAGSVLLVSDGGATRGRAERAAAILALRGIPVHTRTIAGPAIDDAFPQRAVLPDPWRPGGVETVTVVIDPGSITPLLPPASAGEKSGVIDPGSGTVVLLVDGEEQGRRDVTLRRGYSNRCSFPVTVDAPGGHELEIVWSAGWDCVAENDRLVVPFAVQEPIDVVWIRAPEGNPAALLAGAGFNVRAAAPGDLGTLLAGSTPDLVVLDDTPAAAVGDEALRLLADRVTSRGTGLLLAGARSSFGPGGYARSPIEPLLPVLLEQREERRDPSVSLALIVDTSGSMGNRVDLAKEVARLALSRLKPHDRVGIVEFYGHKRWAAALQPASNQIDILRALNRLQAGGGTVLLPAIEEAYYGLMNVTTRFKHVMILTDGGVERGTFEPLVRRMAEKGITCSTVLVGPGRDSEFLLNLAQWGRGRYYQAPGRFQLPEIILKQPLSSILPPFLSGSLAVSASATTVDLKGLDMNDAPSVSGAVETRSRDGAEVLLEVGGEAPLLARWRFGLGRVVCWTTETQGPLLGGWSDWEGYGRIFRRVLREAARRGGRPWLEAEIESEAGRIVVKARAGDGAGAPLMAARLSLRQGGKELAEAAAVAPGSFLLDCPLTRVNGRGVLQVRVTGSGGEVLTRFVALPREEFRQERALVGADEGLLARLRTPGGGLEDPDVAALAGAPAAGRCLPRVLSPGLLLFALFLYLVEILLRRLPVGGVMPVARGVKR
jgi:Ca-activated chloride channel homolog